MRAAALRRRRLRSSWGQSFQVLKAFQAASRAASASAFPALAVVPTTSLGAEGLRETMRSFVSTHSPPM